MITAVQNNPSYTLDEIIDGYNEMCGNEGFSHGCPFGDFDCGTRSRADAIRRTQCWTTDGMSVSSIRHSRTA